MHSRFRFFSGLLAGVCLGGIVVFVWFKNIQRKYDHLLATAQQQERSIAVLEAIIDSIQQQSYSGLLHQLVEVIDAERRQGQSTILKAETISRIASLSYAFRPVAHREGDSVSTRKLSKERGQLLLFLSGLELDTATLQRIFTRSSFAGSDLQGADLHGASLQGVDLTGADLSNAKLNGVNLTGAHLARATFWGSNLQQAILTHADLTGANLSWCDINNAHLEKAILTEADLTSAQLRGADLHDANLQWVELGGAFLNSANLDSADMFRASCKRTQFEKTILTRANLNLADLTEANMTEAVLIDANLLEVVVGGENWIQQLREWHVVGIDEIEKAYKVVTSNTTGKPFFQVKKKP